MHIFIFFISLEYLCHFYSFISGDLSFSGLISIFVENVLLLLCVLLFQHRGIQYVEGLFKQQKILCELLIYCSMESALHCIPSMEPALHCIPSMEPALHCIPSIDSHSALDSYHVAMLCIGLCSRRSYLVPGFPVWNFILLGWRRSPFRVATLPV